MQFDERLKVLEERERAVADLEDADGREGLAEQAATTVQLRDAVERQERRIDELERSIESERYRRQVAESVLEDPSLMHNLAIEIERLQAELADRERELEGIGARGDGGGAAAGGGGRSREQRASSRARSPSTRSSCSSCAPDSRTSSTASSPICARAS